MSLIKMGGKAPDGKAKCVTVNENGNVNITRYWGSESSFILEETEVRSSSVITTCNKPFDARGCGFVSLRIKNTLGVEINATILADVNPTSDTWMMKNDKSYLTFVIPANEYSMVTPEDIPELNYLRYLKLRLAPQGVPTSGVLSIEVIAKR